MEIPHPIKHGNWVAQENYYDPGKAISRLNDLHHDSKHYYKREVVTELAPQQSRKLVARAVWRAGVAPLVHGIELLVHEAVAQKAEKGESLLMPEDQQTSYIDQQLAAYGKYSGNKLRFLRAISWHAIQATYQLRNDVANKRDAKMQKLTKAFKRPHFDYLAVAQPPHFTPSLDTFSYLKQLAAVVNVTTLNALQPAMLHAGLWPVAPGDRQSALANRAAELSWTSSMSAKAFESSFADQSDDNRPRLRWSYPFAHDAAAIVAGSIWSKPSLEDGPWELERYCPGDIILSRDRYSVAVSASQMRFESAIRVAGQVW